MRDYRLLVLNNCETCRDFSTQLGSAAATVTFRSQTVNVSVEAKA